jgi:hypothetical protein
MLGYNEQKAANRPDIRAQSLAAFDFF